MPRHKTEVNTRSMDLSALIQNNIVFHEKYILCEYRCPAGSSFHLEDTARDSFHVVAFGGDKRYTHCVSVPDDRTACYLDLSLTLTTECYHYDKKKETCGSYFGKDVFFVSSSDEKVVDDGHALTLYGKFSHDLTFYRDAEKKFVVKRRGEDIYTHFGLVPQRFSFEEDDDVVTCTVENLWTGDSSTIECTDSTRFCFFKGQLYQYNYDKKKDSTSFVSYETERELCNVPGDVKSLVVGEGFLVFTTTRADGTRTLWTLVPN